MKRKLLFINGHLNAGGVEKSLVDVLRHLDASKYEVDLLLLEGLGDYAAELPEYIHINLRDLKNTYGPLAACLFRCIRNRDWFSLKMRLILTLRKLLGIKSIGLAKRLLTDGKNYDCVIGFRSGICSELAVFAVNANKRVIWWHHGEVNVDTRQYEEIASACDCVAVVSNACRDMLAAAMPGIEERIVVVPNMLDEPAIEKRAQAYHPYTDGESMRLVTVGRLSPEKHVENVMEAAAILKQKGLAFTWHIVGDGVCRKELEDSAKDRGLEDCVRFEGNQSNPYPFIRHADLLVHSSYVESQGLAILEAMALGVPCVVTKSRGPCEFIIDGENGLLTEQNAQSLAQQVERMLCDRALYEKIKRNTKCPEQYRVEAVMEKIDKLFA